MKIKGWPLDFPGSLLVAALVTLVVSMSLSWGSSGPYCPTGLLCPAFRIQLLRGWSFMVGEEKSGWITAGGVSLLFSCVAYVVARWRGLAEILAIAGGTSLLVGIHAVTSLHPGTSFGKSFAVVDVEIGWGVWFGVLSGSLAILSSMVFSKKYLQRTH